MTVKVGDELPTFTRETGFANWNRYAAVNDEFVPIHMDDAAGEAAGNGGAFGMGNLQWAYLHNMLRSWVGENGEILSIEVQFRSPNVKGQTVTAKGVVTAVDGDVISLDVWTEQQEGTKLAPGSAKVKMGK
ncbi:MAG: MaoC/PaaZ C-terminal domain-containing protein [Actinomycetota bacterium]|nr:MaoC/PaaZ C-terminal domain-containing protein [Actinomycetota bacterium]MDP2288598.1 MaoC/PaaZ C-terminal domain-containing protein [Actinomycetota bacterium]